MTKELTDRELQQLIFERLDSIDNRQSSLLERQGAIAERQNAIAASSRSIAEGQASLLERQGAIARATRNIADGLSTSEGRFQTADQRWDAIQSAALAALGDQAKRDLSLVTAHELAGAVKPEVINKARNIQWARKRGEPEPLPDAPESPEALVPMHHHRRKDDSITFKTDAHGDTRLQSNIKVKTLAGWAVAAILGGLHVWQLIANALHGGH